MKVVKLTDDYDFKSFDCGSRTGCVFITVDALRNALPFYFKNRFNCLDKRQLTLDSDTVQLYFNLNELDGII